MPHDGTSTRLHARPAGALYSADWVGVALLLALFVVGGSLGPRGPVTSMEAGTAGKGEAGAAQLSSRAPGRYGESLQGRRIVIDPGHGGPDAGAVGLAPIPEKAITLDTARRLARKLRAAGAEVRLTRYGDELPGGREGRTLSARVELARSFGAEVLVSLHADSHPDPKVRGVTTFYPVGRDRSLAVALHEAFVSAQGVPDRGVRPGGFHVIRMAPVPAALVELGFVTHPEEARLLASPAYRERAASALAEGLARYFASAGRSATMAPGRAGRTGAPAAPEAKP